jgi:hypothetical protein
MSFAKDGFHVKTSLSENQVEELLKETIVIRTLSFWLRSCEGFAGQIHVDKKEFEFAYFHRKAKCAVVKGFYTGDADNAATIHFAISWPIAEVLLFVVGILASIIVPFFISTQIVALPTRFLIIWTLIPLTFCTGVLVYYYIPSIKRSRAKLLELFAPNVISVMQD